MLWKGVVEDLLEEMILFFYPVYYAGFDYGAVQFLDKELAEIAPKTTANERRVDKLIKLKDREGEELWLILHVEVQGYVDKHFEERMFQYFYRIYDRYKVPVEALVIYTDASRNFHPRRYVQKGLKTRAVYEFHTYKVLEQDREELEESENPFAMLILTALEAIKSGKLSDEDLLKQKIALFRKLLSKGFDKKAITSLGHFVENYVAFSRPEMKAAFEKEKNVLLQTQERMGLIEMVEKELLRQAEAKGKVEGIKEGKIKGIKEGKIEGIKEGKIKGIKEGKVKGIKEGKVRGINQEEESNIAKLLLNGFSVEEVGRLLDKQRSLVDKVYQKLLKSGKLPQKGKS